MRRTFVRWVLVLLVLPGPVWAVEPAPALSDREIAERLTRLETRLDEGLKALRADIQQLRANMGQLREDMNRQNQQLREDMNLQFARQFQLTLALLGAFAVLVAGTISFAVWDRRTMIRPFERTVQSIQEDLSTNRNRLDALLEAFRALGQRNPEVAAVLKQFNLL
jgi:predicted  nucleic acid-binding Zn-ribbon protein